MDDAAMKELLLTGELTPEERKAMERACQEFFQRDDVREAFKSLGDALRGYPLPTEGTGAIDVLGKK